MNIKITIEGTSPLLCNKFSDGAALNATNGVRSSLSGDKGTPREQAEERLYKDSDGNPVIPQPNLLRCIVDAGIYHKIGKMKVTTLKTSVIPACVTIDSLEFPIVHKEAWTVDSRAIRNPATGGRLLRYRPLFHDWSLTFEVSLETDLIGKKVFREILDTAGRRIGLGDFRPACKGPFGKFVVTNWEEKP